MKTRRLLQNTLASFFCCILAFAFSFAALWKKEHIGGYKMKAFLELQSWWILHFVLLHEIMLHAKNLFHIDSFCTITQANEYTNMAGWGPLSSSQSWNLVVQIMKTPKTEWHRGELIIMFANTAPIKARNIPSCIYHSEEHKQWEFNSKATFWQTCNLDNKRLTTFWKEVTDKNSTTLNNVTANRLPLFS